MSDTGPAPRTPPAPAGSRRARRALFIAAAVVGVLLVLIAVAYLNRRAAARQLLVGWLEQQGIDAEMEVQQVELDGLVARIRIGDPADPDVTIERVEVDYAIGGPWSKGGLGLTPSRIRLVRPILRASVRGGTFSLGSLDPLVERFTGRPPRPDSRSPLVLIEQGRVRLATDFGSADIVGDARLDDGKLMRMTARMPATALKSGDLETVGLEATLDLTTRGDRVALSATAAARRAGLAGVGGEDARLTVTGDLPYPDLKTRRGDGRARLAATLRAARLTRSGATAHDTVARLTFDGQVSGWIEAFRIEGVTDLALDAARIDGRAAAASAARLRLARARATLTRDPAGFGWGIEGPASLEAARAVGAGLDGSGIAVKSGRLLAGGRGASVSAGGRLALSADRLNWTEMGLRGVRGTVDMNLRADGATRLTATGSLAATDAAWPLFGRPARDDVPELAAMKRSLSAFAVDIPAWSLTTGAGGTRITLDRPALLRPASGGTVTVRPVATAIFTAVPGRAGGGALALEAQGGGLPAATFAIPAWRLTPRGFTATLDGRLALDFGLARAVAVQTRGELASSDGRLTYVASRCLPLTVERLELDDSDVADIAGSICPVARPLVTVADGSWRAEGALSGIAAAAPFLALQFRDAEGHFTATGGPRGLGLDARIASVTVDDATTPRRFNALQASGAAQLIGQDWSGAFGLTLGATSLGRLSLAHDGRTGSGGVTIDAPSLVFVDGGLQPSDLTPMAGFVGSPAAGSVGFQGRVDWGADVEGSSSGRLSIAGLDFVSPAGPIRGLRGVVDFTNLAPLTAAPGQRLTAEGLESVAPLTDLVVTFGLDKAAVTVEGGDLVVGSGRIRVEPFAVPLDPAQPIHGVIVLDKVQLGQVIAGAGFGDKVSLDAVVSGRLPFTFDRANGLRISGGSLSAVQPGRLAIARTALTGLQAGGGGEGVPPNTVQDLAYQAMENLSFDILSAEVNSLDQGRIGVLFRIRGRHDPPQHQELRISIADFISREFLNRELPLPSGTGIDLTLDTTLNVNQLVSDLLALNRAREGRPDSAPPDTPQSR